MEIVLVLPNIRSAHNVGSLFRTADGSGCRHVYLTGYTPQPIDRFGRVHGPQKEIAKTALGAEKVLPYTYTNTLKETIKTLKEKSYLIIGLEQDSSALKLSSKKDQKKLIDIIFSKKETVDAKVALVLGEEVSGLTKNDLKLMDVLIELPMFGKKESLNVSVAGGIALYILRLLLK